jgi:hypothetical protein
MAPQKNVTIEPEILERASQVAASQGKTVDELANDAMKRELARLFFARNRREAEARRGSMTEEDVEAEVGRVVHEWRAAQRAR